MRHRATKSLFERQDVIVIASVSCIYGLGMPDVYLNAAIRFRVGDDYPRQALLHQLVRNQYPRQDVELKRASFRLRGDIIDVHPADEERVLRLEFFDTTLESMSLIDPTSGEVLDAVEEYVLYPAVHHVTEEGQVEDAIATIKAELKERLAELDAMGKHLEAERLKQRTFRDITMIKELGYCNGIENYSRIFDGRAPGTPPRTLIDYFPRDFLLFVDESHVTVPQLRGMYHGDRSRKDTLVEYGFRLPCARDNRPLTFDEFYARVGQRIYISATPSKFELEESPVVVEQIIRPTGLIDPTVTVIPTQGQVEHMLGEIQKTIDQSQRVIITTLTKRMAEDLTEFLNGHNVRVRYLHSDIKSLERIEIIRDLRLGEFDVLVGVNLLREGLDLPEVSLVAIMDADKEGFLRSDSALIQTIGRAARNAAGRVLLYADKITDSMARAMDETERRRAKQLVHNKKHNITPLTIYKPLSNGLLDALGFEVSGVPGAGKTAADALAEAKAMPKHDLAVLIEQLNDEMKAAAGMLEFEKAAKLRDQIKTLQGLLPVAS
jgi:excinuclease ABC subunit B